MLYENYNNEPPEIEKVIIRAPILHLENLLKTKPEDHTIGA